MSLYSLRGRRLKGKGKGVLRKGVFIGARETRGAREVSRPNSLPLPFRTPATQASPFKDPAIELRSVTSRYHGSKISGAQATTTATATRTSKKERNKQNNNFARASRIFLHFLAAVVGHEI